MLSVLAASLFLAITSPAPETPVEAPRIYINENRLALVLGYQLNELSFVTAHCEGINRYMEQILFVPLLPPPKARIEIMDTKDAPMVSVRNLGGEILTQINLKPAGDLSERVAEAATCTWLARAALAGGRPYDSSPIWLRQALKYETINMLRPSMIDGWYREGRNHSPTSLEQIIKGQGSDLEAFLFWRAARFEIGSGPEQIKILINSAQGQDILKLVRKSKPLDETWWMAARANLLLTRTPVSLGMHESAEALDDLARFIFDLGQGDVVLTGPEAVKNREVKGVQKEMQLRLVALRRELLRQNPVYHNAWRTLGTWLENFPTASPEQLDQQWKDFLSERASANDLRQEIERLLVDSPK